MQVVESLKEDLQMPPLLGEGLFRAPYATEVIGLREEVVNSLIANGFIEGVVPLEELHLHVSEENQVHVRGPLNTVSLSTLRPRSAFMNAYHRLIKYIATDVLKRDFVFETTPVTRFHFPVSYQGGYRSEDGTLLTHHTDLMFGDPIKQINCWLPLTPCHGTNSLQCTSLRDSIEILHRFCQDFDYRSSDFQQSRALFFDRAVSDLDFRQTLLESCLPLPADFGEIILFDARLIHCTAENSELQTRVSIDFRILLLTEYEKMLRYFRATKQDVPEHCGLPLLRDAFYDARSALQL